MCLYVVVLYAEENKSNDRVLDKFSTKTYFYVLYNSHVIS